MRASYIAYRKVGEHRGCKRIWLQGVSLLDSGFAVGDSFETQVIESDKITLTLSSSGDRKVARKKIRGKEEFQPVVDLSNKVIADFFEQFERCKISFYEGIIVISYHPTDKKISDRLIKFYEAISTRLVKTGSLSHGGGIMSTALASGLCESGFNTELQFAIELEKKYLESSINNSPIWTGLSVAIEGLMQDVELDMLDDDVVIFEAGLPCVGSSIAGKAKNKIKNTEEHETAGALFYSFLSQIKRVNPALIVLENVSLYEKSLSFHVIKDVITAWGYDVGEVKVLNGTDFGAIENRSRMFMVAVSHGIKFDWNNVLNYVPGTPYNTLGDAMEDISDNSEVWSEMKGLKQKQIRDLENSKGFMMQIVDRSSTKTAVIGKGYSKVRSTEPKISHSKNPELLRQLTVKEHARVKSIPESLINGITKTTAHEILGQSVIYNVVKSIGYGIGQCLLGHSKNDKVLEAA